MKIKLCVIGKREWEKVNELTGEQIHCFFYSAFDEKSKPMEFKSNRGDVKVNEVLKYDDKLAETFDLQAIFDSFKQKLKFSEIESK